MNHAEESRPIRLKSWRPVNLGEWCGVGILQIGWLTHLIATVDLLGGVFMFPAGLVFLHIHTLVVLFGLTLLAFRKWFSIPFVLFSLFGVFSDWNPRPPKLKSPAEKMIPIMTWNIQGLDTLTNPKKTCAIDFLQSWLNEENNNGTILLQEVPKSAVNRLEKELDVHCTWNSYFNHSKIGLLVCSGQDWRFRFENHRTMDTGSSYGFQQVELSQGKRYRFNILNVHMPSLAMVARKQGIKTRRTIAETLKANRNPTTYAHLLKAQHKAHQSSMERIADLSKKLKDPTVIGGDFNTPPTGSVHDVLTSIGMQDAHTEVGRGWGFTTERFGILFSRIDFLYGSKELTWFEESIVHNDIDCSDHFPVTATFILPSVHG